MLLRFSHRASSSLPPPPPLPSGEIAAAFRDWFRGGEVVSLLDRIYAALASSHADDDASLDAALSPLRLPLSESLVLSALRHRPRPSLIPPSSAGDGSDPLLLLRLRFFDWSGRQHPYRHSRSAYHAIFRLLSRSPRGIPVVLDWLRLFSGAGDSPALAGPAGVGGGGGARPFVASIGGGPSNPRFLDTLVVGYSVAGKPELALHLLGRMRFRGLDLDAFSFHVLLNALVDASLFDFADSLHSHIASRGLAGPVTSCIRLKALCRQGRFTDAELLLRRDLPPPPPPPPPPPAPPPPSSAPSAAAAASPPPRASWTTGRLDDALDFLARKRLAEDYIPEVSSYNDLLRRLLRENLRHLDKVYDLLVEMLEEGIAPDRATMNAALRFFCKAGLVDVAVHLYNARMELGVDPNNAVYNELIAALCREGDVDQACAVLETSIQQGYFPGRQTFTILANVLCREGKLSKMQELLDGALKRKVRPISAVFAKYLSALCKAGDVEEAFMLPQMIGEENAAIIYRHRSTYTSLITAFITMGRVDVLPRFILEMQDMGHTPSRSLYRSVVCSLCERDKYEEVLGLLDKQLARKELDPLTCYNYFIDGAAHAKKPSMARELYTRMENAGIQPNTDTDILLLHGYLKSKRIFDALSFFNYLREKRGLSNKLYNVFISGLCEAGKPEQAVVFWKEARERGLIPSLQCYEELVLTLSSSKDYDTVALLRAWLQSRDKEADVDSVGMSSEIQDQQSGRLLLGQLIAAFSGGIRLRGNLDKLEEEIERFFPVDIYTYNMLLRGLSMGGRMDLASSLFERLCKKGFQPNRWTFDIMVHGFCKDGQRKEAERWMQAMARNGFFPTWYTMRLYNNAV
uniref:Pentatricopeptide repeat-containing protein n=1 Tax=Ananas comosus var. bracteatus TaxID=296719 RepID=A0A6V7NQJ1_ANACO|nr:unnamed protein product [Ananas comosus var. bracteatus]